MTQIYGTVEGHTSAINKILSPSESLHGKYLQWKLNSILNPTLCYATVQKSNTYIKTNSTYVYIWVMQYLEPGTGLGIYSIME